MGLVGHKVFLGPCGVGQWRSFQLWGRGGAERRDRRKVKHEVASEIQELSS